MDVNISATVSSLRAFHAAAFLLQEIDRRAERRVRAAAAACLLRKKYSTGAKGSAIRVARGSASAPGVEVEDSLDRGFADVGDERDRCAVDHE